MNYEDTRTRHNEKVAEVQQTAAELQALEKELQQAETHVKKK